MNPLTWMRENQHQMLVFFTVMLMAGFGALGVMSNNVQRSEPVVAPTAKPAVTWTKGTATDLELQEAWRRRLALQVFLSRLLAAARQIDPNYTSDEAMMLASASPEDVPVQARQVESFNVLLLAQKARDLGIQVSDDTIDIKLKRFVNVLSMDDMRSIAADVGRNAGMMSYTDFRELLKREFLARQTFMLGIEAALPQAVNPAAAFSYFSRTTRRFDCQVLEFVVNDYLPKVTESPSDAELRQLFAEGQYRYPAFDGSKPGFKIGNRLKLEYFVADPQAVISRLAAEIPAEEARAEYDRLLAEKDPMVYTPPPALPDLNPAGFPLDLGTDIPLNGPETQTPPAGTGDLELPPVPPTVDGATEKKEEATENSQQGTAEEKSDGEQTGGEKTGGEQTSGEQTSGEQTGGEQTGGEQTGGDSLQYVSLRLQDETQQTGNAEAGSAEQKETQAAETQAAETQAAGTDATATTATEPATAAVQEAGATPPPAQETPPVEATPPSTEPKIRTFEETENEIRQRLARPKALEQIRAGFDDINKQLRVFRTDFRIHQAKPDVEPAATPIDYQALAKKHQFIFNQTPVIDQATFQKTQLGSMGDPNASFANQLFGDFDRVSQDPYASIELGSPQRLGAEALVWVTEAFPARAAQFDEVRDQVIEYWKMGKARDLALADAKAKAAQIAEGQKLKDVHPTAVETGSFSWLTSDMFGQGLRISNVVGTDSIGEEFMETVTNLDAGKTGTAFNADRSRVYVVQKIANAGETQEELIKRFLTDVGSFRDYPFQVRSVLQQREFQAGTKFIENLRDEYQVNFVE